MSTPELAGPALLYVQAGTLDLETADGDAWVRRGRTAMRGTAEEGMLGVGDGAQIEKGAAVNLRNAGDEPLAIMVLTIFPDGAAGPGPGQG